MFQCMNGRTEGHPLGLARPTLVPKTNAVSVDAIRYTVFRLVCHALLSARASSAFSAVSYDLPPGSCQMVQ